MIELDKLSKIGMGTYRMSDHSSENREALCYAIQNGCNLIDTASNYMNGESEKLIGRFLNKVDYNEVFIISKAGYISGENINILTELNKDGKALTGVVNISDNFKHSIHPDYLQFQIDSSLRRLNRKFLDCFMLHSPEYYFQDKINKPNKKEYYIRIRTAFEFLEDKVQKGIIRYYGVSSNTLHTDYKTPNSTDINKLIMISKETSVNNHFKMIQFPFNIIEREASLNNKNHNRSLLNIAKENGLTTLGNRPLNANSQQGLLRLVIHDLSHLNLNDKEGFVTWNECVGIIKDRLIEIGNDSDTTDIGVLVALEQNWMKIDNTAAFEKIFHGLFFPFINLIFDDKIPLEADLLFKKFESICWNYHLKALSEKTIKYLKLNNLDYLTKGSNSLAFKLCKEYLSLGIDHVLVGMRKKQYVNDMKDFF